MTCISLQEFEMTDEKPVRQFDEHHFIIMKDHCHGLKNDTKIYRYMRLSALLDMIYYKVMHVPNMQDFTDLREKKGHKKIIEQETSLYKFPNFKISAVPSYREILYIKRKEKERLRALSVCVSCWTLDKRRNNENDENFLMWKAYSKDDMVCRIGTTIGQLINSIKKTNHDIIISDVDYNNKVEMSEFESLIFKKSIHYEDEQEVRMVVLSDKRAGIDLQIDIPKLLNEIKISPFIPPVLSSFILWQLKTWCKNLENIKIDYSNVMEYVETNKNYKSRTNSRL